MDEWRSLYVECMAGTCTPRPAYHDVVIHLPISRKDVENACFIGTTEGTHICYRFSVHLGRKSVRQGVPCQTILTLKKFLAERGFDIAGQPLEKKEVLEAVLA